MTMGMAGLINGWIVEGRRFQFVFPSEESLETVLHRGPEAFSEPASRVEFVRLRLNWNVDHLLRFHKNFQFTMGVNTLLRFHYERLRGFCDLCGMLTHDTWGCQIPNGDGNNLENDDEDDQEDEPNHIDAPSVAAVERNDPDQENQAAPNHYIPPDEFLDPQPVNPKLDEDLADIMGHFTTNAGSERVVDIAHRKRKFVEGINGGGYKTQVQEVGEGSGTISEANQQRIYGGVVGPEPPLPPWLQPVGTVKDWVVTWQFNA